MTAVRPERETLEAELRAVYEVAPYPAILAAAEYLAVLAAAPDARCDCHLHDHQVCDVCQGVTVGLDAAPGARLAEALALLEQADEILDEPLVAGVDFGSIIGRAQRRVRKARLLAAAREGTAEEKC